MQSIPRIMPVSDLRTKHKEMFGTLNEGPIVLAQRSKPTAVLVSVEQWSNTAEELKRLQRIIESDAALARMEAGDYVTEEEYEQILQENGLA